MYIDIYFKYIYLYLWLYGMCDPYIGGTSSTSFRALVMYMRDLFIYYFEKRVCSKSNTSIYIYTDIKF